jgi:hypothetical protein
MRIRKSSIFHVSNAVILIVISVVMLAISCKHLFILFVNFVYFFLSVFSVLMLKMLT